MKVWKFFVKYFIRGLVFVAPIAVTILLLMYVYNWLYDKLNQQSLGIALLLLLLLVSAIGIAFVGYLGTSFFWKPIAQFFERWIRRIPLVNTVYSSTKDVVTSFLGDKKKFDKPVLVTIDKVNKIERFGFITQQELEFMGIADRVAVYCPISYSVAGDLIVVEKESVRVLEQSSSEMMRFLISAGLTQPADKKKPQ